MTEDRCPRKMWPGGVQCTLVSGHRIPHVWAKAEEDNFANITNPEVTRNAGLTMRKKETT